MARPRMSREEWQEHAAAKVAAALQELQREVAALQSGDDWQRFLTSQARLHAYSPNNVMLIWSQHLRAYSEGRVPSPEPTYIAGFRTWQALDRQVDKGQKGYTVLAPVRGKQRAAVDDKGNIRPLGKDEQPTPGEAEASRQVIRGFKVEYVFDASQTSGKPLPAAPMPKLLEGEAPPGLGKAVLEMIEARGFTVDTVPDATHISGANGQTVYGTKRVLIRADMDDAAMVKTIIHEAAHVALHEHPPSSFLPRARKEVEAESVAYVVAAAHGMPTDEYTFPYVAGWASTAKDPAKEVAATQARVARAAKVILEASPAEHVAGGTVPGTQAAVEAARLTRTAERERAQASPELGVA
jgi:hypothetical protein